MKYRSALLILLVCNWSETVRAQAADSWVNVSPAGELFTIRMPISHVVKSQKGSFDQFRLAGRVYTATSDGVDYAIWSWVDEGYANNGPVTDAYLDACADLVWESLLKPLRDELPKSPELASYMSYQGELESSRLPPGREYTIMLGNRPGLARIFVAGKQIYVLTVLNAEAISRPTQHFINSFSLNIPGLPVAATIQEDAKLIPPVASVRTGGGVGTGSGVGPGRGEIPGGGDRNVVGEEPSTGAGESTDYNRIFSGREVTQKARVHAKPEPAYTESARRYSVQGTVILRAVFSDSGEVNNIRVVRRLPHGLTQRALAAAREIKFIPALKDGHAVSMYIQLEYNFNLY